MWLEDPPEAQMSAGCSSGLGIAVQAGEVVDPEIGKQHTRKTDDTEDCDSLSLPAPHHA